MESKIRTLILFIFLLSFKTILAQDWVNYLGDADIQAIAEEGDFLYVGFQHGGLRKINKTTGEITLYHKHNSGLTSNNITSIVIDTNGDKWIGTDEGILGTGGSLFKFNDVNWEEYNYDNSGIRNVYSITIDNSGNKLIGTQSGLFIFNGTNWTKHLPYQDGNSLDNVIYDVEVNTNGEIWVNASQKLAKFDGVSWTYYGLINDLRTLLSYKDNMWFGTDRGLFKFDGTNWSVFDTSNSDISNNKVYSLFKDKNDILWIGGGGLSKFDGQNWTVFNVLNSNINSSTIEIVIIDRDGIKWMKTEKGLVKFDEVTSNIIPTANTIPSNNVKAIAIENNIKWIGTDKGLTKFDGTSWVTFNTENSQLPSNEVTSIRIDQVGNKWIGTNNGIAKFDGLNWTIFNSSNSILNVNFINYIEVDNKNHIWVLIGNSVSASTQIFEFDGIDWIQLNTETQSPYIDQMAFDSNDNLWIVDGYYLDMFDGTSWTNYNSSNSNLTKAAYSSLAIDKNDVKWIGAVQDGFDYSNITKLEGVSNFTTYSHNVTSTFRTRKILIDDNDNKWIGDLELIKYDNVNWTVIDSKLPLESMPSNGITDLAIDSDNKLWIATAFGLAVYTLPDNSADDDSDGVVNNLDLCPNTPTGEPVDANGCSNSQLTIDDDNDGISNLNDDCPNTPANDIVNTSGCSIINIPDVNFEQALIDLGFDSDGIINQQILSSDAIVVTNLNLYGKNINDLTGIEGFNNLTTLLCGNNNLTYLNVSYNTKLIDLQCNTNNLTSLDISNNIALTKLFCAYNQITNLDVTTNILLEQLDCSVNQITSLNLTNNNLLTVFSCHTNNPLNSLNIKNGNNTKIITFYANLNPNLTCITVDNANWSTLNWTAIDSQTSYSENCGNNDTDGDGVYDTDDLCPATPLGETVDSNGCSASQLDDDGDGVMNNIDICPNTLVGQTVDANGCSDSQVDTDNDGILDINDTCPETPTGETVDVNGCSQSQLDDDNDGVVNSLDTCPNTPAGETVDVNGCSNSQLTVDDDNDGISNLNDDCPNTPANDIVNASGCSIINIPDVNFEQALIDLGFDSDGIINQQILSSDATVVTNLNLYGKNINDLTGIEGFNNLTTLLCSNNNLTYLNVSYNTKLVDLQCNTNSLTSLDISNNIALTKLFCAYNQITNLDVTTNILLEQLDCSVNQITSLNLTNNNLLTVFSCHTNNPLNSLNIKNGNNTKIITFYANLNPNLTCITVDNVDWSTLNWTAIDSQTSYSENCGNNDTDGDGVYDTNDLCPATPSGETVDSNGCSQSQLDDDNDGVVNSLDLCPNTPTGETVDENGCALYQLDTDADGVTDDIDLCPATPSGETVDTNGCSASQLDDDNDSVMNNLDQCPNTPAGETVDANGCILLASNNFTIDAISETCPNKNNGRIIISTLTPYNYTATLNGTDYNFTTDKTITNLSPGNYEMCITVKNITSSYCYNFEIKEGVTVLGKSSTTKNKTTVEIIEGTPPFNVFVNGKVILKALSSSFDIDVAHGDFIEVKTAVACEGIFSKTIDLFEVITVYPNPTSGTFKIALPMSLKEVKIALFTINNQFISSKTYLVVNGKVQLNIENMPAAVYFAKVYLENQVTVKILKQ